MCDVKAVVRAFDTINDMLIDRGLISNRTYMGEEEVKKRLKDSTCNIFDFKISDNDYKVTVLFHLRNRFQKQTLNTYRSNIQNDTDEKHVIFVFKDKINAQNEKNLKDIYCDVDNFETFCLKNLLFNITRHNLVPKHELVNAVESEEVYRRYSIKTKQQNMKFPLLLTKSDPVAKYYDFKPGQLVRITRPSSSIGESISYRFCV